MTATIRNVTQLQLTRLISQSTNVRLTESEKKTFDRCLATTDLFWVGLVDDNLVCVWGLIAPTLLSEQAYLWLYTSEAVKDHEFLFVRHSQRAVEEMLKLYSTIVGVSVASEERTIRWLKWLGAEFGIPENKNVPFAIRKK